MLALIFSAMSFFTSFFIIGHNPTIFDNAIKIPLWYIPLLLEMVTHFIPPALRMKGHVHYSARGLYSRASILFLIVLGQGLDQITGTFSNIVGTSGFGGNQVALLCSTMAILVGKYFSVWCQKYELIGIQANSLCFLALRL
jgi:hypothetical protein